MSTTSPPLFTGWLGYGSAFSGLSLLEPTDLSYFRRPLQYASFDGQHAWDVSVGSIGPAAVAWPGLAYAGLFDARTSGNLIAVIPVTPPVTVAAGATITARYRFSFRLCVPSAQGASGIYSWIAGAELGKTPEGLPVTAGVNLQLNSGILAALGSPPNGLSLSSLPATAPASGSGQLWNNGGVICIA